MKHKKRNTLFFLALFIVISLIGRSLTSASAKDTVAQGQEPAVQNATEARQASALEKTSVAPKNKGSEASTNALLAQKGEQASAEKTAPSREKNAQGNEKELIQTIQNLQGGASKPGQGKAPARPSVAPRARWHRSNLERHWEKHGAEFPEYHSADEYGDGALRFFQNPPQGTLTKVRPDGEKLYYHPPSNTFGVTAPDGTPKTLFRPTGRMNYWNRQ